jgi:predicted HD phosphohydrolase
VTERSPAAGAPSDVDALLALLTAGRRQRDGEPVDLLAHARQCAAALAEAMPDDPQLVAAGLVHDLGTVLAPGRPATHARTGADAVRALLGTRVADLVGGHDLAKRYLVTVDARYRDRLSARSVATLRSQGGLLDPDERTAFEARPDADALVALRRADDAAKVPGLAVPELDHWRDLLEQVAARASRPTIAS